MDAGFLALLLEFLERPDGSGHFRFLVRQQSEKDLPFRIDLFFGQQFPEMLNIELGDGPIHLALPSSPHALRRQFTPNAQR
jgi:hypothetical protein